MPARRIVVRPVTPDRREDYARLFSARGAPGSCWCAAYRFPSVASLDKAERRRRMEALVSRGVPVGVLAYDGDEPVGWCSVAPRETYRRLERSRVMPRVGDAPTWTLLCFFVPRARRGEGIARALLKGAVRYARKEGAVEVEAYPWDASGVSSTHLGRAALYRAAGFEPDEGRRWVLR